MMIARLEYKSRLTHRLLLHELRLLIWVQMLHRMGRRTTYAWWHTSHHSTLTNLRTRTRYAHVHLRRHATLHLLWIVRTSHWMTWRDTRMLLYSTWLKVLSQTCHHDVVVIRSTLHGMWKSRLLEQFQEGTTRNPQKQCSSTRELDGGRFCDPYLY